MSPDFLILYLALAFYAVLVWGFRMLPAGRVRILHAFSRPSVEDRTLQGLKQTGLRVLTCLFNLAAAIILFLLLLL